MKVCNIKKRDLTSIVNKINKYTNNIACASKKTLILHEKIVAINPVIYDIFDFCKKNKINIITVDHEFALHNYYILYNDIIQINIKFGELTPLHIKLIKYKIREVRDKYPIFNTKNIAFLCEPYPYMAIHLNKINLKK